MEDFDENKEFYKKYRKTNLISFNDLKKPIRLSLGCSGRYRKGDVGVDIKPFDNCVVHDCRKIFPLSDGSVERILTEDIFEHLTQDDILDLLYECYRILEDNGFPSPMPIYRSFSLNSFGL